MDQALCVLSFSHLLTARHNNLGSMAVPEHSRLIIHE